MSAVEVRTLKGMDPKDILELWGRAGLPHRPRGRDHPSLLEAEFSGNPDLALGAFVGGRLVGTVIATDDGRKGWINRLAVDPAYRRQGIATLLLEAAEEALKRRGRRIVAALVEEWNRDSLAFFAAKGYRIHRDIFYLSKRESEEV